MPRVRVSTLSELINVLGTRRIARACGTCHGTVYHWRTKGLPMNHRATRYREVLCELGRISEKELAEIESGQEIEVVPRSAA